MTKCSSSRRTVRYSSANAYRAIAKITTPSRTTRANRNPCTDGRRAAFAARVDGRRHDAAAVIFAGIPWLATREQQVGGAQQPCRDATRRCTTVRGGGGTVFCRGSYDDEWTFPLRQPGQEGTPGKSTISAAALGRQPTVFSARLYFG